jgi:hypothetical protein
MPAQPVYGQAPGQPMPPPTVLGTPAKAPSRRRRRIVSLTILIVLVAGIGIAAWISNRHSPDGAKVGDCVHQTGTDSVEVIACTDPNAQFKVVGRVENQSETDASISSCDAFDNATQVFWSGQQGGTGYVLCLAANH